MLLAGGIPRSGTSMLMRVLEKGGIDIEYNKNNKPQAISKFRNYYGFYETANIDCNKTFKVFNAMILKKFPDARFIYIYRDIEQVYKSWLQIGRKRNIEFIKDRRNEFEKELENHEHIKIKYEDMHKDPRIECERIKAFLNGDFNVEEAIKAVDKNLFKIR